MQARCAQAAHCTPAAPAGHMPAVYRWAGRLSEGLIGGWQFAVLVLVGYKALVQRIQPWNLTLPYLVGYKGSPSRELATWGKAGYLTKPAGNGPDAGLWALTWPALASNPSLGCVCIHRLPGQRRWFARCSAQACKHGTDG